MNSSVYPILYHDMCICIDKHNRMSTVICMIVDKSGSFVMSTYNTNTDVCEVTESDDYDELYNNWLGFKRNL